MTQVSSFYLHVPFCKHLCNYCDFYKRKIEPDGSQFEDFHQFLKKSVIHHNDLMKKHEISWAPLETIYLGGGTPSLWGARGATIFQELLFSTYQDAEFTMEIDPGTCTDEMLSAWKAIGLNRISIGTQTLDPEFLKIMDRVHSLEDTIQLLERMQKENWNYSLDFLLGIPFSKEGKRDIKKELDLLLKYHPKHISLYILNARSKYPHIFNIPDDEYIREEYLFVSAYLKSKDFHHYEVSNFARPGFESKHNQKYWRGQSVAALGPTGTGYFSKNDQNAIRYKWKVTEASTEIEVLTKKEVDLEKTYLSLRTSDGWVPSEGTDSLVKNWEQLKYAEFNNGRVKLTSLGFLMLDSLMDDIFKWEATSKRL
jgi:oxygen-independent coproporphyrinogen-3 oxidase